MKKKGFLIITGFICLAVTNAQENPFMDHGPAYTNVITGRSEKIVNTLEIADSAKYKRVVEIIVEQYRNLGAIHDFKDAQLQKAKRLEGPEKEYRKNTINDSADAQLYARHVHFIAALSSELKAEQVELVKDGMTYGVFHNTYDGYLDMLPELTEDQKRFIYTALYEARERAMDQGSSKAKHAMFGKYKGRVNNYLSAEGYDLSKRSKEWEERLKKEGKVQ